MSSTEAVVFLQQSSDKGARESLSPQRWSQINRQRNAQAFVASLGISSGSLNSLSSKMAEWSYCATAVVWLTFSGIDRQWGKKLSHSNISRISAVGGRSVGTSLVRLEDTVLLRTLYLGIETSRWPEIPDTWCRVWVSLVAETCVWTLPSRKKGTGEIGWKGVPEVWVKKHEEDYPHCPHVYGFQVFLSKCCRLLIF